MPIHCLLLKRLQEDIFSIWQISVAHSFLLRNKSVNAWNNSWWYDYIFPRWFWVTYLDFYHLDGCWAKASPGISHAKSWQPAAGLYTWALPREAHCPLKSHRIYWPSSAHTAAISTITHANATFQQSSCTLLPQHTTFGPLSLIPKACTNHALRFFLIAH